METIVLEIPNAETLKLVEEFATKNGIEIGKNSSNFLTKKKKLVKKKENISNPFLDAVKEFRSKIPKKPKISMAEITREVDYVRQKRYEEKKH